MNISQSSHVSSPFIGGNGAIIIKDTATYEGYFYAIKAITGVVINTLETEERIEGSLDGVSITAGDTISLFRITSIKLSSGTAIIYKA